MKEEPQLQQLQRQLLELQTENALLRGLFEEKDLGSLARGREWLLHLRENCVDSLSGLVAGAAHEINQPLAGIRGLAEHIILSMDRGHPLPPEKIRAKLQMAIEQTDRLSKILQHLREFSTPQAHAPRSPVQIHEVIHTLLALQRSCFRASGVGLEYQLEEGLPPVMLNALALEHALAQLLFNAKDAVLRKVGSEALYTHPPILLRTSSGAGTVAIEVVDRGVGIPAQDIHRVFELAYTTKRPMRGVGLGLPIARSIAEEHGGSLTLSSTPDQGTTATLRFPACKAPA